MTELFIDRLESAIGQILIVTDGSALCAIDFADYTTRMMKLLQKRYGTVQLVPQSNPLGICDRLHAYFQGALDALIDLPVNPGGTTFQQQVWFGLRSISVGSVLTYGQFAAQLGKPNACRAVGMTNGLNPVAIVLPCHRVIGAQGKLTGYAGGLERKQWLLRHEGVDLKDFNRASSSQANLRTADSKQLELL